LFSYIAKKINKEQEILAIKTSKDIKQITTKSTPLE